MRRGSRIKLSVPMLFRGGKEGKKPEKEDEKGSLLKAKENQEFVVSGNPRKVPCRRQ